MPGKGGVTVFVQFDLEMHFAFLTVGCSEKEI